MMKYGLLGHPLHHSFSKKYFTDKFNNLNLNFSYENFDFDNIENFISEYKNDPSLVGFNVTIPYKSKIIPYLDDINESAEQIGAVNVVQIKNGKWKGFNSDIIGFKESLLPLLNNHHRSALILGNGGASKAVAYVLQSIHIPYRIVSRNPSLENELGYEQLDKSMIENNQIIINTTPLGMHPKQDEFPAIPYESLSYSHLCYDLIYNPEVTQFLAKAQASGAIIKNGLEMLILQAEAAWEIWNE